MDQRVIVVEASDTMLERVFARVPAVIVIPTGALLTQLRYPGMRLATERRARKKVLANWRFAIAIASALAALAAILAAAGIGRSDERQRYLIRVPIPSGAQIPAGAPAAAVPPTAGAARMTAAAPPVPIAAATSSPAAIGNPQASPALLEIETMAEAKAALSRALATGVAVPWGSAGLKGYAIAGPTQVVDNHLCRNAAIWAEARIGGGAAFPQRFCKTTRGGWVKVGPALPAASQPGAQPGGVERELRADGDGAPPLAVSGASDLRAAPPAAE